MSAPKESADMWRFVITWQGTRAKPEWGSRGKLIATGGLRTFARAKGVCWVDCYCQIRTGR
jgi:hypothetical protein